MTRAELAYYDLCLTGSGARQPVKGAGDNWGTTNQYLEFTINVDGSETPGASKVTGELTRRSSETTQQSIDEISILLTQISNFMTVMTLGLAEFSMDEWLLPGDIRTRTGVRHENG